MKKCTKCNLEKEVTLFGINNREHDGRNNQCKDCQSWVYRKKEYKQIVNLDGEIWKDVIGYEGMYCISNKGRIKSLPVILKAKGGEYLRPEKLKSKSTHHSGYFVTSLTKYGIGKSIEVHRLIAMAFIPNPENKEEVNHINYNRSDNALENLEWVTIRENISHGRTKIKTHSKYTGVSFNIRSGKWMAYCAVNSKLIHLGATYKTEEEAAVKYNNKLDEIGIKNKYRNVIV